MAKALLHSSLLVLILVTQPALAVKSPDSPDGDSYSFHHQLGFLDGVGDALCFSEHMVPSGDNTVLFDGLSEFLAPYLDGTLPFVFEFETPGGGSESTLEIISMSASGTDLFPEGFEDPKTGTPLDAACIEIGIDDTLDSDPPASVDSASLEFLSGGMPLFPDPIDITSAFPGDPWDGRLSIVFSGFAGLDINEVRLTIVTTPSDGSIFADGFESGDTTSWTD